MSPASRRIVTMRLPRRMMGQGSGERWPDNIPPSSLYPGGCRSQLLSSSRYLKVAQILEEGGRDSSHFFYFPLTGKKPPQSDSSSLTGGSAPKPRRCRRIWRSALSG